MLQIVVVAVVDVIASVVLFVYFGVVAVVWFSSYSCCS